MFQFRRFPTVRYGLAYGSYGIAIGGFPIRISPDQCLFAAPRSFSQLITSFIGSWCQGIPLALFIAWLIESSITGFLRWIMQTHKEDFFLKLKLYFTLIFKNVSLLLPSHNLHHFINVQFSRYISESRDSMKPQSFLWNFSQSLWKGGGPKWTRTTDLTIISRVL